MARAVVVAPAEMVLIVGATGPQAIEQTIQVGDRPRLEFDRRDTCRGSDDEDRPDARAHAGLHDRTTDVFSDVMGIALTAGVHPETRGRDHRRILHFRIPVIAPLPPVC